MANKFLVVDEYNGNYDMEFDTLQEAFDYLKDEEVAERGHSEPRIYEILREVKFKVTPVTFYEETPETTIPAPNPGETVADYARRITAG